MENMQEELNGRMDEFQARGYIIAKGKAANTPEDIKKLLDEVLQNFNYDYGVAPRSAAAFCVAAADFIAGYMGMTGFQASFIASDFVSKFSKPDNKCGWKIVDFDKMLYPQYREHFADTITAKTWKYIQEEAARRLKEYEGTAKTLHPNVRAHWESIVAGNVPFGYAVMEED